MIDSLQDGPGLLPFKLGPAKVISHFHSFLQNIDLADVHTQVKSFQVKLLDLKNQIDNNTLSFYDPHISFLNLKIQKISNKLESFEPTRNKRGLIDGLGSIIKGISGNLDYTDALKYNQAIKILQDNERKIELEFNHHVSLSKEWMSRHSDLLDSVVENQKRIIEAIDRIVNKKDTDVGKYSRLVQYLLMLSDSIESLYEEINQLEINLAFIRASSTPHSIISLDSLKKMLDRLRTLYAKEEILDIELREYYDRIKLGYFYVDNKIVVVFKIPLVLPITYDFYKLSIIPNKNHAALIPVHPYVAIHSTDSLYIETECPKTNSWYLCENKHNHISPHHPDCVNQLITKQELHPTCYLTPVILNREALEQLDDRHYTISFPVPTKVKISCGQEQYKILNGSFLAVIPYNCYLSAPGFTITNSHDHVKGRALKINELPLLKNNPNDEITPVKLNSINLENLHDVNTKIALQSPMKLEPMSDLTIYHTTIPIYTIVVVAAVVGAIILSRGIVKKKKVQANNPNASATSPEEVYAKVAEQEELDPKLIRVNHAAISATMSSKVRQ